VKKSLWLLLCLYLALILTSCDNQADEVARLEAEIAGLEDELNNLMVIVNEQNQAIIDLQDAPAQLDEQHDKILASFMDNLYSAMDFLGIHDLSVPDESIEILGNIVTARSSYIGNEVILTFRYNADGEEIRWTFIEYIIGPIAGPANLDGGKTWWQWQQTDLFDENFTMRFFLHSEQNVYEYFDEEIAYQNWQEQVINHMLTHTGIRIAHLWYEESRVVVDLKPAGALPFNWGSHGSAMSGRSLIDSLATLPNITEIEILVGGQRGVSTEHFYFGVVRLN
jgi:hypothetical protein